jgi:hypothetical protein
MSNLYVGGGNEKKYAIKDENGKFIQVERNDPRIDANGDVFQLPAGAFDPKFGSIDIGGGSFSFDGNNFSSPSGSLEVGKVYVRESAGTFWDVPMLFNGEQFIRLQEFQGVKPKSAQGKKQIQEFIDSGNAQKASFNLISDFTSAAARKGNRPYASKTVAFSEIERVKNEKAENLFDESGLKAGEFLKQLDEIPEKQKELALQAAPEPDASNVSIDVLSESFSREATGTIPEYKGVYKGKEDLSLNNEAVNHLFKEYHNRDANQEELGYWNGKKVGNLEDTLAKTQIFPAEEADRIREQMRNEGKTHISNQAELESLARSGGLPPESLQVVSQKGGMLFRDSNAFDNLLNESTQQTNEIANSPAGGVNNVDTSGGSSTEGNTSTSSTVVDVTSVDPNEGAYAIIDNAVASGSLPSQIGDLFKTVVSGYPEGVGFDTEEIISTFNKIREETIDPQFRQMLTIVRDDFQNAATELANQIEIDREVERKNEGDRIRQAQKDLSRRGMTFSGEAIEKLGDKSAFARPNEQSPTAPTSGGVPTQQPFGGNLFFEGEVNQTNRLINTSRRNRNESAVRGLARKAEQTLGTGEAQELFPSVAPLGNVATTNIEGSVEDQRKTALGSTLNSLIDNFRQKENLNTNTQF